MTHIYPGDLVAVHANDLYYYAVILDRVRLFGGNWVYAFHRTSSDLLPADAILNGPQPGFHAFVDFILAKREDRLTRVAKKVDIGPYNTVRYLKGTHLAFAGKAPFWFIYGMDFQEVKRVQELSQEEKMYPLFHCTGEVTMVQQIDQRWTPDMDPRV